MKYLTIILLAGTVWLSPGAAEAAEGAFFATGAFEYQFAGDRLLTPGCNLRPEFKWSDDGAGVIFCTGKNPRAEFKLGYEFAFGDFRNHWWLPIFQFGYKHESNWFSGKPFNDDREMWSDKLFLEFKFGGLR